MSLPGVWQLKGLLAVAVGDTATFYGAVGDTVTFYGALGDTAAFYGALGDTAAFYGALGDAGHCDMAQPRPAGGI